MHFLKRFSLHFLYFTVGFALLYIGTSIQAQTSSSTSNSFISGGLAWSPDGSQIAVGTNDGVWIHQTNDLDNVHHIINANFVTALDWHPTENWIATGSSSPKEDPLRIWDANTGEIVHVLSGHQNVIDGVKWSPDGQLLATTSWDETLHIWDITTSFTQIIATPQAAFVSLMDWSQDSRRIVTMHLDSTGRHSIFIYDTKSARVERSLPFNGETWSIQWSPDDRFIAVSSNLLSIWNTIDEEFSRSIEVSGDVRTMVWSPDSTQLVIHISTCLGQSCNEKHNRLAIIDIESGKTIAESQTVEMSGDGFYANAIAYSPDATQIASISDDGRLLIFSARDLTLVSSYNGYKSLLEK